MKNRKLVVFIIINIELVLMFVILALSAPDVLKELGSIFVIMLVGNGAQFTGGNVWHAWQKSKYFNPELKDKDNEK